MELSFPNRRTRKPYELCGVRAVATSAAGKFARPTVADPCVFDNGVTYSPHRLGGTSSFFSNLCTVLVRWPGRQPPALRYPREAALALPCAGCGPEIVGLRRVDLWRAGANGVKCIFDSV